MRRRLGLGRLRVRKWKFPVLRRHRWNQTLPLVWLLDLISSGSAATGDGVPMAGCGLMVIGVIRLTRECAGMGRITFTAVAGTSGCAAAGGNSVN
jgi:hypothetical protein